MSGINYTAMPGHIPAPPIKDNRAVTISDAFNLLLHQRGRASKEALICLEVNRCYLGNGGFLITAFHPAEPIEDDYYTLLNNLNLLVEKEYENTGICYVRQLDSQIVVLSCFPQLTPEQNREDELYHMLYEHACRISDLCRHWWNVHLYTAVSNVIYSVNEISITYFNVCEALEYNAYVGNKTPVRCDFILIRGDYLSELTRKIVLYAGQLANETKTGNFTVHSEILKELLTVLVQTNGFSLRQIHFNILIFSQALMDALVKAEFASLDTLMNYDILGQLYNCHSTQELTNTICSILICIQDLLTAASENKHGVLVRRAKEIVDTCYKDCSLTTASIAEQLGISQSMLSILFRTYSDSSISSYIRSKRVEEAKHMLGDTTLSMDTIAKSAGFGSLNTMYRAFKAIEGVSPGRLRSL